MRNLPMISTLQVFTALNALFIYLWLFLEQFYKVKVKSLSRVRLFATPWTVAYQSPLSMGFSRQEYWSGLPFPSPGDLPDPGVKPRSSALQADTLPSEPPGKPRAVLVSQKLIRKYREFSYTTYPFTNLSMCQMNVPNKWYICYSWWTSIDMSLKAHS